VRLWVLDVQHADAVLASSRISAARDAPAPAQSWISGRSALGWSGVSVAALTTIAVNGSRGVLSRDLAIVEHQPVAVRDRGLRGVHRPARDHERALQHLRQHPAVGSGRVQHQQAMDRRSLAGALRAGRRAVRRHRVQPG
jgi:hypothetical protein